jgi:anti-sigma factor RsiW
MKMSHIDEGTLHSYLDGEVSDVQRTEIEGHLATCDECRANLETAEALSVRAADLLAELEPGAVQAPTWREIEERAAARRRAAPRRFRFRPGLAWAASIALAFAIGWLSSNYWLGMPRFDARQRALPAFEEDRSESPELRRTPAEVEAGAQPESQVTADRRLSEAEELPLRALAEPTATGEGVTQPVGGRGQVAEEVPAGAEREDQFAAAPQRKADTEELADELVAAEVPPVVTGLAIEQEKDEPRATVPVDQAEPEAVAGALQRQRAMAARTAADAPADAQFIAVQPEDAEVWIGAELRTLPDLLLKRSEVGPGAAIEGAESRLVAIRLIYEDAAGHEIVLIQQWVGDLGADAEDKEPALIVEPSGRNAYRWLDGQGYLFILQGEVSSDSLRALAERLR